MFLQATLFATIRGLEGNSSLLISSVLVILKRARVRLHTHNMLILYAIKVLSRNIFLPEACFEHYRSLRHRTDIACLLYTSRCV